MRLIKGPVFRRMVGFFLAMTMMMMNMATFNLALAKAADGVTTMAPVQLELTFDHQNIKLGEEAIATLKVKGAENLYGFDISLKYDPQFFEFQGVTPNTEFDLGENGLTHEAASGILHIIGVLKGESTGINGNVNLLEVKFKAKAITTSGKLTLLRGSQFSDGNLALYTLEQDLVQSVEIAGDGGVTAPTLQSAVTDKSGTKIILTFNKAMSGPTGSTGFSINVSRNSAPLSESVIGIEQGTDGTQIILNLEKPLLAEDIVEVSYTPGTLTSTDGGALAALNNQTVTNNAPRPVVFDDSHTVTLDDNQKNLAITSDTISSAGNTPLVINVPSGVTNASINLATLLQSASSGKVSSVLPPLTISAAVDLTSNGSDSVNVQLQIPQGTTVIAPAEWDGTLNLPTVAATNSVTVTPSKGKKATVNSVIEVGFGDVPLTFNHAVRLLVPGQAGKKAGYVRSGTFYPISTQLSTDEQTVADNALADGQEGYLNVGADLVIWTKHFTRFVTYTETSVSGGSSGGGGGRSGIISSPAESVTASGLIEDGGTGKAISGVNVSLYYAQTERNIAAGKTPDTIAALPITEKSQANNNKNPQISDLNGAYGFEVSPAADYYIVAAKDGYEQYKSPTIPIEHYRVNLDIKMNQPKTGLIRLAGYNKVDTALAIAKAGYKGQISNVVLATAENFPDALAGSVLAYRHNAPILLIGSSEGDQAKVINYMKSSLNPTGTVYILGGSGAVSKTVEEKIAASGFTNITRLGGIDKYETALKIAEDLDINPGTPIVLAYGENYPDALSISSAAAVMQYPIFLVGNKGINDSVQKKLTQIKPSRVYIIGGEAVISAAVENQVTELTSLAKGSVVRLSGVDRIATSLAVANYFNLSGQNLCIATGNNFPDALAGSVYAANSNAPIILTDSHLSQGARDYLKMRKSSGVSVFGGEAVISKAVEQEITEILSTR